MIAESDEIRLRQRVYSHENNASGKEVNHDESSHFVAKKIVAKCTESTKVITRQLQLSLEMGASAVSAKV